MGLVELYISQLGLAKVALLKTKIAARAGVPGGGGAKILVENIKSRFLRVKLPPQAAKKMKIWRFKNSDF